MFIVRTVLNSGKNSIMNETNNQSGPLSLAPYPLCVHQTCLFQHALQNYNTMIDRLHGSLFSTNERKIAIADLGIEEKGILLSLLFALLFDKLS